MLKKIDFTNCEIVLGRAYNGANGKKIAIIYNGEQYMLKFPSSGENKKTDLSYTNSCFSEHIASSIFNMVGISAQKTILGTYTVGEKEKIVCACKDFTSDGSRFFDFCSIKNTILDSDSNGVGTELEDVLNTIEKQKYVLPSELLEHFWNVFIIDALLGNFDRHNGNWGFLYNEKMKESKISPVYDCGSCLLPQADENVIKRILSDENELNARIYQFPTSAIKLNDKKINYFDFISSNQNVDCAKALKRMLPKIDLEKINSFIDGQIYIDELQKKFYKYYIINRYEKILLYSYNRI